VGLDGGYVKAQGMEQGWFEVIAEKSILAFQRGEDHPNPSSKCLAFVQTYDQKPQRRLVALLQSQGLQMNQQIEFLSDGGDTVRDVQLYLSPEAEHLLDWFHLTMRLTTMPQSAKGLPETVGDEQPLPLRDGSSGSWSGPSGFSGMAMCSALCKYSPLSSLIWRWRPGNMGRTEAASY
jgi:hypothetical protein